MILDPRSVTIAAQHFSPLLRLLHHRLFLHRLRRKRFRRRSQRRHRRHRRHNPQPQLLRHRNQRLPLPRLRRRQLG